jgi:protein phosphatase
MNIWGITDIGAVRNDNQDNYQTDMLDEDTLLAVVCDGMGGARAGNVASSLAVAGFVSAMKEQYQDGERDWSYMLEQAVYDANRRVHEASLSHEEYRGMGTTLVAALATPERIFVANVGDSRCYQIVEGDITRISRDHSLVEDLVQRGELTPEEARVHPKKNLITRALGVDRSVKVDIFEKPNLGGYLLLCSDGLSNEVTDEELRREVVAEDKEHCCQRLLKIALDQGARDNITVVIAQL